MEDRRIHGIEAMQTVGSATNAMQWVNMTSMNPFGIMVQVPKGI